MSNSVTTTIYMAASGIAFADGAAVASVQIIAPGSAGNLLVEEAVQTGEAGTIRYPSTAYTSLISGQLIKFDSGNSWFQSMYLTLPTSAIALVNIAAR